MRNLIYITLVIISVALLTEMIWRHNEISECKYWASEGIELNKWQTDQCIARGIIN